LYDTGILKNTRQTVDKLEIASFDFGSDKVKSSDNHRNWQKKAVIDGDAENVPSTCKAKQKPLLKFHKFIVKSNAILKIV
jgi:hypothetical protein